MKRISFTSLCTLLIWLTVVPAQSSASRATADDSFTLLVLVQSRHVDYFEACVPVRVNEPFTIVWGSKTVKEIVTGTVGPPDAGEYPTTLKISEGNGQCRTEIGPKLKLDDPFEWSFIVSLLFKHIDTYKFVLSKKACAVDDAPNKSGTDAR